MSTNERSQTGVEPRAVPVTPCDFDPELLAHLPYDPEVLLFDQLLEVDPSRGIVRCRMPVHADLPLTRSQRVHPVRHPRHVNGGLVIHATGMLGLIHAFYVFGLSFADGWIGYGTHIHRGVFRNMIVPGEPVVASARSTRAHHGTVRHFVRYELEFRQRGGLCYQGDQSALWVRPEAGNPFVIEPPRGTDS